MYLRGRVEGVPGNVRWEVVVTMVHTNRVNLLFVTLDTVGGSDIVSEDPGFSILGLTHHGVGSATSKEGRAESGEIPVDCVPLNRVIVHS